MMSSPGSSTVSTCGVSPGRRWNAISGMSRDPFLPPHRHDGVQGRKRDAHVGGVRGDAALRGAEHGVVAIEAVSRVAALAGRAFVAARGIVVEIEAAGALHEIAADRRHVADLAEAPARIAWASRGNRSRTRRSAATAVFFTPAPMLQASAFGFLDFTGEARSRPPASSGCSMVSRMRSTRLVPPPRYWAPARAPAASAALTSEARSY